jgi:arylsulfatase A-like enzyme
MPFLSGNEKSPPHEVLYWRFGGQWAIRKGDWKLCANSIDGIKNVKLFNLKDDIGEATDLSAKDPEKVKELQALWDKWSAEQAAPTWMPRDPAKPGRKASSRKRASKGK